MPPAITAGRPYPLGATWDGDGTNFAVYSAVAERIELCLFDGDGRERRVPLPEVSAHVHHGRVAGVGPGQRYGFRVRGPWAPPAGQRCNPAKLLLDPYARAIAGDVAYVPAIHGHRLDDPLRADVADSAPFVPRSVVVDPRFDWGDDRAPDRPLAESVIYETHVRGLTMRHPAVPPELRGTFAGMALPPVIEHLVRLGVTAVELLPVQQFVSSPALAARGLHNYWGYDPIGYFAPHAAYAAGADPVREFKQLVRALHRAGIEVILDVVYNHTGESDHHGPTLCYRGLDNAAYYVLAADRARYLDTTGCGNSLNAQEPVVLRLIMDSLRYWVGEMHVDGVRFDLATTLARGPSGVDMRASFLAAVHQDPLLSRVKLIAEPWDLGDDGYQAGRFPAPWVEWNDRYRDTVRDFWRGTDHTLGELASRFTGSADRYAANGRGPAASVNFVTCHDGFTLADLVAYNRKHNAANGEDDGDGADDNRSWNSGVEGPAQDRAVRERRAHRQRALLATLLLSQGVPLLLGGDELGRTQRGNNNAYCQDNELAWYDWAHADGSLLAFTRALIALRAAEPAFRRRHWSNGTEPQANGLPDVAWYRADGTRMTVADWEAGHLRTLGVFLNGAAGPDGAPGAAAEPGNSFLVLFNAYPEPVAFTAPPELDGAGWAVAIASDHDGLAGATLACGGAIRVPGWSLLVLRWLR